MRVMEIRKKFSYGLKKTKYMVINTGRGEKEEIQENVKAGVVTECEEYKYVGLWVNQDGNCLCHIAKKKESIKGEIVAIKTVANPYNLGPCFLNVRLQLYQSCIIQSLLFNLEGWSKLSKKEYEKLESVQAMGLCSLLGIPKTTPYIGLLNEVGMWSVEMHLVYRKIIFYHNIMNSDNKRLCRRILVEQESMDDEDTFYMDVKTMAMSIGLDIGTICNSSKDVLKKILKSRINDAMLKSVEQSLHMRKLRFVRRPVTFEKKKYLSEMDGKSAMQVVQTRLNMLPIYGNFKGDVTLPRLCPWCEEADDTTEHILTCKEFGVCKFEPSQLSCEDDIILWHQVNSVIKINMDARVK